MKKPYLGKKDTLTMKITNKVSLISAVYTYFGSLRCRSNLGCLEADLRHLSNSKVD